MPAYKDKNGKWKVNFRYTDWTGKTRQSTKRGFEARREAVAWERALPQRNRVTVPTLFRLPVFLHKCVVTVKKKAQPTETPARTQPVQPVNPQGGNGDIEMPEVPYSIGLIIAMRRIYRFADRDIDVLSIFSGIHDQCRNYHVDGLDVRFYRLSCNMDVSAADLSCNTIKGEST